MPSLSFATRKIFPKRKEGPGTQGVRVFCKGTLSFVTRFVRHGKSFLPSRRRDCRPYARRPGGSGLQPRGGYGSKPKKSSPSEHLRCPTKIGSTMGSAPTPKWYPWFLTHGQLTIQEARDINPREHKIPLGPIIPHQSKNQLFDSGP